MNICYRESVMNNIPIENRGSLMTVGNTALGYLMDFKDKGIFSPNGKMDVTPDEAQKHNAALSAAEIKGLDDNCQVGQMGIFYYTPTKGVHTWIGTVVSPNPSVGKHMIAFTRNGKTYRGLLRQNDDSFTFKRIS